MAAAKLPSNDVIETIINGVTPQTNHLDLIAQLRAKTNLLSISFAKSYDGYKHDSGVYDSEHNLLHQNANDWIKDQVASNDGNAYTTWSKLKDKNYFRSTAEGSLINFIMQFGNEPSEFIQLQVYHWHEVISHHLIEPKPWQIVKELEDLTGFSCIGRGSKISNPIELKEYYEFDKIFIASDLISRYNEIHNHLIKKQGKLILHSQDPENTKSTESVFTDKFPEIVHLPSRVSRLMEDWAQSSAGMSGHVFSNHWLLNNSEWTDYSNQLSINIVPYWRTNKPIKEVKYKKNMTAYTVADIASKTDTKSGYPFSWYFYMLHGNRIGDWFGMMMLRAAESGEIFMSDQDYLVLKRWGANKYGF